MGEANFYYFTCLKLTDLSTSLVRDQFSSWLLRCAAGLLIFSERSLAVSGLKRTRQNATAQLPPQRRRCGFTVGRSSRRRTIISIFATQQPTKSLQESPFARKPRCRLPWTVARKRSNRGPNLLSSRDSNACSSCRRLSA